MIAKSIVSRHTVVCQWPRYAQIHQYVIYATGQVATFSLQGTYIVTQKVGVKRNVV